MMGFTLPSNTRLISRACRNMSRVAPSLFRYCSSVTPPSPRSRANSTMEFVVRNWGAKHVTSTMAYSFGSCRVFAINRLLPHGFLVVGLPKEALHEFRVDVACAEVLVRHDPLVQRNAGVNALHHEHVQGTRHA